jgi:hypothetical protein
LIYVILALLVVFFMLYQIDASIFGLALRDLYSSGGFVILAFILFIILFILSFRKSKHTNPSFQSIDDLYRSRREKMNEEVDEKNEEDKSPLESSLVDGIEEEKTEAKILPPEKPLSNEEIERMLEEKLKEKIEAMMAASAQKIVNDQISESKNPEKEEEEYVDFILYHDGKKIGLPIVISEKEKFVLEKIYKLRSISSEDLEKILLTKFEKVGLVNGMMKRLMKKMNGVGVDLFEIVGGDGVVRFVSKI